MAYQVLFVAIHVAAIVAVGTYVVLYPPWHWRTSAARDASGLVLTVGLLFAWSAVNVIADPEQSGLVTTDASEQAATMALGLPLVFFLWYRLVRFLRFLRRQRAQPMRTCPQCGGMGAVPVAPQPGRQ